MFLPSGSRGEIYFLARAFSKNEQNVVPWGCRTEPAFLCSLSTGVDLSLWSCTWPMTAHKQQEGIEFFSYCQLSDNTRESSSIFKVSWLDLAQLSNPVWSPHLRSTTLKSVCLVRQHIHRFQTLEGGYPWGSLILPTTHRKGFNVIWARKLEGDYCKLLEGRGWICLGSSIVFCHSMLSGSYRVKVSI